MVRTPSMDKSGMKKGTWTPEEDKRLIAYVTRYGSWNWRQLPRFAGLARCGKSCRLRWLNYLRPDIKRGNYTKEEEEIIVRLHQKLGSKWSVIAANLPGRTDNDIKNHWNSNLKKRFERKSQATHKNNVKATTKPNDSGSKKDTDSEQNNSDVGFFQVTPQTNPLSPQLSEFSSSTTTATDASNENIVIDGFDQMNEDIWSESFLAELMPDIGVDTFQGSDSAMRIPDDSLALSPQSSNNSECLVAAEYEHFGFVESTQPAVENSWIDYQCVADMSHVPNEIFPPVLAHESDEYFCPHVW